MKMKTNEELMEEIRKLSERVERLERNYLPQFPGLPKIVSPIQNPTTLKLTSCPVCDLTFDGAMGYVCNHEHCPSKVTCT